MNNAQKKIVKEAKKRNKKSIELNQNESFRKSRIEVKKTMNNERV